MGGAVYLDGKVMVEQTSQEWQGGGDTQTGFDFSVTLNSGNHVLQYLGSQKCCDGTTKWQFKYSTEGSETDWLDFTTMNLNKIEKVVIPYYFPDGYVFEPFPL